MECRERIVELDGLRGLAVLLVVIAHYFGEVPHGIRALTLGWIGVDLFFVLSGFLIGGILLDNRDSPDCLATFYARRALRIFPAYYLMLAVVLIAAFVGLAPDVFAHGIPASAYFAYIQNFAIAYSGDFGHLWLLPTWTLAVEEQFYWLLPLLICFAPRRWLLPTLTVAIITAPVLRSFFSATAFVLLPCRWDTLLLGVVAALARRGLMWKIGSAASMRIARWLFGSSAAADLFVAIGDRWFGWFNFDAWTHLLVGICCASYLLLITAEEAGEGRFLRSRLLRFFGTISYGLYLFHQPVNGMAHSVCLGTAATLATWQQATVSMAAFAASVGAAWFSWVFFEAPLIEIGHRWQYRKTSVMGVVPAAVGGSAR